MLILVPALADMTGVIITLFFIVFDALNFMIQVKSRK